MVKTEDTYLSMIEDQSSNSDLITIADLVRADAFNLVVVSLRANWESYRDSKDNTIILRREDMDLNWDSFVDKIANDYFFERRFSQFFAQTILNKLRYTPKVIGYDIRVDTKGNSSGTGYNFSSDENALAMIVEAMFEEGGRKIDVVDCNQDSEEKCNGSFYLTFNTINLDDEAYERLPTIAVKREKNNEVMQRPVLARQYYKIYMPWRGFQAMRVARRIAYSPERETSQNPADFQASQDYGLFNPLLHNTLEQARLGVCDPNTCGPRTNFFETSSKNGFDNLCNMPSEVNGDPAGSKSAGVFEIYTPEVYYNLGALDTTEYSYLFNSLVKETIKSNLNDRESSENITFTKSLEMVQDGLLSPDYQGTGIDKPIVISKITASINGSGAITKKAENNTNPSPGIDSINSIIFNPNNPDSISEEAGGLGIFYDSTNGRGMYAREINSTPPYNQLLFSQNILNQNLKCFELGSDGIQLDLIFQENNPRYSILNNAPKTHVRLIDNYTEFTFPVPLSTSYLDTTGYIEPCPSNLSPNANEAPWTCESYGDPSNPSGKACVSP